MKKILTSLLCGAILAVNSAAVMAETADAAGQAVRDNPAPSKVLVVKNSMGETASIAQLDWQVVYDISQDMQDKTAVGSKGSVANISGSAEAKILEDRGISSGQFSNTIKDIPVGAPIVVSTYDPFDSKLAVSIIKVEKLKSGKTAVLSAYFTPEFGGTYRAARSYIDPANKRSGAFGIDPFEQFRAPLNGVTVDGKSFYNVTLQGGMLITGLAAKYAGASYALMTYIDTKVNQRIHKSGNKFKKKTTVHVDGWAKAKFYTGAPVGVLHGNSMVLNGCATAGETCPDWAVVNSGFSFHETEGGTYTSTPGIDQAAGEFAEDIRAQGWDRMSHWQQTKSGYTFLTMMIVAGLASLGAGLLLAPATANIAGMCFFGNPIQMAAANILFATGNGAALLSTAMASAVVAGAGAGIFVGAQLVQGNGLNSVYDASLSASLAGVKPLFLAERIHEDFGAKVNPRIEEFKNEPKAGAPTYAKLRQLYDAKLNGKAPSNGTSQADATVGNLVNTLSESSSYMEVNLGKLVKEGTPLKGNLLSETGNN